MPTTSSYASKDKVFLEIALESGAELRFEIWGGQVKKKLKLECQNYKKKKKVSRSKI